jgi:DNA-binding LacI/PurR family transcriptional regulator
VSGETIVTVNDMRAARLCAQGARDWFARHGLDWMAFLREGLPASAILATGDAMAARAVEAARAREARGG